MALKSTIFKFKLSVSNLSKNHYKDYFLTTAKHPSETDERLVCRIIAFALNADDDLVFAKGLSDDKEPDLWQKSLDGRISKWIEIGQPDEKKLRQLCGKSESVEIYCHRLRAAQVWWETIQKQALKLPKLNVTFLEIESENGWSSIVERTMDLNCIIEEESVALSSESDKGAILSLKIQKIK